MHDKVMRGEPDELKYLSTRAGVAPGKAPVGGMSELDANTSELSLLKKQPGSRFGDTPALEKRPTPPLQK
jgi:hypothetical protein